MERALPDAAATRAAGAALGAVLAPGDAVALIGDLGAGKTTFVQGVADGAGVADAAAVVSPTFTLVHEYAAERVPLVHVDLYRIEDARELDEIGLDDHLRRGEAAVLVEWADRFDALPADHLLVELIHDGQARRLVARAGGPGAAARLAAWAARLAG